AALAAALTADEDRDYGELELDDEIVSLLTRFEQIAFDVSNEEWKEGVEGAAEINFSAAAAAARWAGGVEWATLVRETRAEEGDLIRLLSRTGEALLQIAGLRKAHAAAAQTAAVAAAIVLREPVRLLWSGTGAPPVNHAQDARATFKLHNYLTLDNVTMEANR